VIARALAAVALLWALPAAAQEGDEPRFCPNRPSLGSSACTVEPGHVLVEASLADWQRTEDAATREDRVLAGDLLVRAGVGPSTELQIGWTALGYARDLDRASGTVDRATRVGDVRLGVRQALRHPDGKGLSFGVEPFVTLPVGRQPIGAGTWGAGVVLPITWELSDGVQAGFTAEADAEPDEDGDGRHLAYSGIWGLSVDVTSAITAAAELSATREQEPGDHHAEWIAAGSVAWQPRKTLQLDLLLGAGLTHDSPDVRVAAGFATLF
jgi:hypothetical protein